VMTNQAVFDKSLPCEGCSVFKVIDRLKELGGAQAAVAIAPVAEAPQHKVKQNDPHAVLWVEAQKGNSADDYQVYIDTYPKGKYLPFAKARIKKLKDEAQALAEQQEQSAWNTAQQSSSEDSYALYLKGYPTGRFAGLAKVRIDKFKSDAAAAKTRLDSEPAASKVVGVISKGNSFPSWDAVHVEVTPWSIRMTWKPIESELVASYYIYQKVGGGFTKIGDVITPEFKKDALTPNTNYTYYIAVHRPDGTEGEKLEVKTTTSAFSQAPLGIEVLKSRPIFSNTYKVYQDDGLGVVRLTNNTDKVMEGVIFSFMLSGFMDFSTESKLDKLLPGQSAEIKLKAVFNNNILNVTEDASVQAMLEASFFENGKRQSYSKNITVSVYEKHKLLWDELDRYASFITPKDAPVMSFVRSLVTQYNDTKDASQLAAIIFNAFGVYGLTYLPDPSNPYQVASGKAGTLDYIQFPRETLERKSGDGDDLVALYTSALESIGIATRVVMVPGHMFMMFSTEIPASADGYNMDNMYVIYEGKLWMPVETTVVGSSFVKAWELGANEYYKWKDKGLSIMNIQNAWEIYKSASLSKSNWQPAEVRKEGIDKKFPGDFSSMLNISSQTKARTLH